MVRHEATEGGAAAGRRPRRMSPHERRADLIATALRVFAERSPDSVTPEDIAEAADVSRTLVYRYFPNMAELRTAALRSAMDELAPLLVPPTDLPLLEQLRTALRAFIDFADRYAPAYVALLRGGSKVASDRTESAIDEVRDQVLHLLLQRSGIDRPSPRVLLAMRCWISSVESALLIWLTERPMSDEELADWLLDQLLAMLGASGAGDVELQALTATMGSTDS
ncbi:AcrR family transcriptional regulator [Nocardiopsis mwathae]|uniref:AcrR family transcriptional regulator n=2 Tax=Nocardiopsis mwathae TaxID=1472723 RepID=A0A7X0D3Q8_9ACTN|nr:AcrR family transcriptional regulator [Nocardiopsis mwathae]